MTRNEIMDVDSLTPEQFELLQNQMNTRRFKALEQTTEQLDERVTNIEEKTPVSASVSNLLDKKRKGKVIEWLGGKSSKAYRHQYRPDEKEHYKTLANKAFAEMARDFKDYFDIPVYADLPKKAREEAEEYIDEWEPSTNTKIEIRNVNNQLELITNSNQE